MEDNRWRSPEPKRRSALHRIQEPDIAYSRADIPRGSAFSRLQGDSRKQMEIGDKRMLPPPPRQKMPQNKKDMRKSCQYQKNHGHDTDDCRHLKIEIEKLIQRGQLKEYVHKETQRVNRRFDREGSNSPPNITERVNVISGGRSGGGDYGSARRAYEKRDIYAATAGARPECLYEDPLVITLVIANFEVGRMLVDTGSSVDILYLDAYLKLGMSQVQIRPVPTLLVWYTRDAVSLLGAMNLMVTMGKHPQ
ncbi:hypothetical protein LIER_19102 [Lithospermum erythrorhizon]|uniref:Reverse transcriptase domain-containing protein n=1 Tax=Lithospermum erythrorhizon TaxID=34254 RepID=A0AAV3QJ59_LITER